MNKKYREINGKQITVGLDLNNPVVGYCYKRNKDGGYYLYLGEFVSHPKEEGFYFNTSKGKILFHKNKRIKEEINNNDLINDILSQKKVIKKNRKESKMIIGEGEMKDLFLPEINIDDDWLVKDLKNILLKERIPLKILKEMFGEGNESEFNNFKRALLNRKSIMPSSYARWMEVLGKDWEISHKDI